MSCIVSLHVYFRASPEGHSAACLILVMRGSQAKKAKAKATNTGIQLPVAAAPSVFDYSTLQKDVGFFGFGDKAKKAASKASSVADDVKGSASSVADKASDIAETVSLLTCHGASTVASAVFGSSAAAKHFRVVNVCHSGHIPVHGVILVGRPGDMCVDMMWCFPHSHL